MYTKEFGQNMSFDLTLAFDGAEYLNPQTYMMIDTLKKNIPKDTILHITTDRDDNDELIQWIKQQIPTKIYKKPSFEDLKSRCQYMFRCFEIETDKDWVIKLENDILILRHLNRFKKTLDNEFDIILQSENRRIIPNDNLETRIWRNIYKAMNIKLPDIRLPYVENDEVGRPLLATGIVCVQSKHLDYINDNWVPLTRVCEKWIQLGIHPNEFAFSGLIFKAGWDFKLFNIRYNFNPIGHFRSAPFPCTELINNCVIPNDIVILNWHRWQWLKQLMKVNPKIKEIVERNKEYIPDDVWNTPFEMYHEK